MSLTRLAPEIDEAVAWRRIEAGYRANYLAARYLLPRDLDDRADAFDGLVAHCWQATRSLYIMPTNGQGWPVKRRFTEDKQAKHEFIQDQILDYMIQFEPLNRSEILALALEGKLGFVVRRVRSRLIDHIRKIQRRLKERLVFLSFDFPLTGEETCGDYLASTGFEPSSSLADFGAGAAPYYQHGELILFVAENRAALELNTTEFEALTEIVTLYERDALGSNLQELKGNVTRAIAERHGCTERQARTIKQGLNGAMCGMLVKGNHAARELWAMLTGRPRVRYMGRIRSFSEKAPEMDSSEDT